MKQKLIIWLIVICMSLTACSGVVFGPPDLSGEPEQPPQPTQKSEGKFKVGNPYKIFGVKYRPRETYNHVETGIASWYGPNFHGKPTANGETFDMY